MFKPLGNRSAAGFYEAFSVTDWKAAIQECATPEQREYNRSTEQCSECKGWGYRIQRKGRDVTRENCGCPKCLGVGKVPLVGASDGSTSSE